MVENRILVSAGGKAISENILLGAPSVNSTTSLSNLTIAGGKTPSPDAIEKETGVKNIINNFGKPVEKTNIDELILATTPKNTGIDSLKVESAASVLNPINTSAEQPVARGQTKIADSKATTEFSRALGTAAALAIKEGFVSGVATFTDDITHDSTESSAVVNKLPNGSYQLTGRGATVMNSMRAPSSALGIRKKTSPWENHDSIDNDKRLLDAEIGGPP